MISFDSWRTPLQLIDNKLQLDVNGLKVALIKKGLRLSSLFVHNCLLCLKVALIKKGLRHIKLVCVNLIFCLKVALIKKGLRLSIDRPKAAYCSLKVALIKKGLRHINNYLVIKIIRFESSPD